MPEWTGLDPAGTEQLWNSTLLKDGLEIFKRYEPFSRNDPGSPIYRELEDQYPDITWRGTDHTGGFRPIFRKNNPWAKLGLVTPESEIAYVTPLGDEVLSGEKDFPQVFIEATRDHREPDGTPSYAIMCSAALEMPEAVYSAEDIEFAISAKYEPSKRNLRECLTNRRKLGIVFPQGSRRERPLRAFMNGLVIAGAFVNVSGGGWTLNNAEAAREISSSAHMVIPAEQIKAQSLPKIPKETLPSSWQLREISTERPVSTITPSLTPSDPQQRAQLLEKANTIHEKLVQMTADAVRQSGGTPFDHPQSIDVAAMSPIPVILEVKTIHSGNALVQVRNAVAKLWEYRWRWRREFTQDTTLIIVTNENPSRFLDDDLIEYLTVDRGLRLFWLDGDRLVDHLGVRLQDFLAPGA